MLLPLLILPAVIVVVIVGGGGGGRGRWEKSAATIIPATPSSSFTFCSLFFVFV